MSREVEGLENLNRILELPLGSKFGMFIDSSMDSFKVAGYLDKVAKASGGPVQHRHSHNPVISVGAYDPRGY